MHLNLHDICIVGILLMSLPGHINGRHPYSGVDRRPGVESVSYKLLSQLKKHKKNGGKFVKMIFRRKTAGLML